jgi:hypothetical protein
MEVRTEHSGENKKRPKCDEQDGETERTSEIMLSLPVYLVERCVMIALNAEMMRMKAQIRLPEPGRFFMLAFSSGNRCITWSLQFGFDVHKTEHWADFDCENSTLRLTAGGCEPSCDREFKYAAEKELHNNSPVQVATHLLQSWIDLVVVHCRSSQNVVLLE